MKNIPDILHVLIEVRDREISKPRVFTAYEEAIKEMEQMFRQALGLGDFDEALFDEGSGRNAYINPVRGYAWANDVHGAHFDWLIHSVNTDAIL